MYDKSKKMNTLAYLKGNSWEINRNMRKIYPYNFVGNKIFYKKVFNYFIRQLNSLEDI